MKLKPNVDFRTRAFWEEVIRNGVMGLTRADWSSIDYKLDPNDRAILRRFLEQLEDQAGWIARQKALMRDEAMHIALIGETMQRAGLRSYTDEKGRIFVASTRRKAT